nr:hypothetical protein [Mesorhizobium sp. L103C565B0]
MATDAVGGAGMLVEERFRIHAVDREQLDAAGVDEFGQRSYPAGILELIEPPLRRREHHHRPAGMAVALVFHVAAEIAGETLVIRDVHRV